METESRHHSLTGKTPDLYPGIGGSSPPDGSCNACFKPTTNPRFCSLSCSAIWQGAAKAWPITYCLECTKVVNKKFDSKKKFCNRSCSASYNNRSTPKRTRTRTTNKCTYCQTSTFNLLYCSLTCQAKDRRRKAAVKWISGEDNGLSSIGTLKSILKAWLLEVRGEQCELCGWAIRNPHTGKVPLVADHIDGNWENNRPENIQIICNNCDSLQSTYKAANVGKGRPWRRK